MSAGTSSGGTEPGCCTCAMMAEMIIFLTASDPSMISVCSIWPADSASLRLSRASCLRSSISASIFSFSALLSLAARFSRRFSFFSLALRPAWLPVWPSSASPLLPPLELPLEEALSALSSIFVISCTSCGMTTRCEVIFSRFCADEVAMLRSAATARALMVTGTIVGRSARSASPPTPPAAEAPNCRLTSTFFSSFSLLINEASSTTAPASRTRSQPSKFFSVSTAIVSIASRPPVFISETMRSTIVAAPSELIGCCFMRGTLQICCLVTSLFSARRATAFAIRIRTAREWLFPIMLRYCTASIDQ